MNMHSNSIIKKIFYLLLYGLIFNSSLLSAAVMLDDEVIRAMNLKPNIDDGKNSYEACRGCHFANGWGYVGKMALSPQLSGQHRSVIIKQIVDFRARNRDNPRMHAITRDDVIDSAQEISNLAAYISNLPMNPEPEIGPRISVSNEERAEKLFYRKCAGCHSSDGSGDAEKYIPLIYGQHYEYLLQQLMNIRNGKRRNADPIMIKRVKKMTEEDLEILANYVSRIKPPSDKLAEPGWKNPDFNKKPNVLRR